MSCQKRRYRAPVLPAHWVDLQMELRRLVNQTGVDQELGITDRQLAKYLLDCLATLSDAVGGKLRS